MSSITVEPIDGSAPAFVAWRDGAPMLPPEQLARAEPAIGQRMSLTPEGPHFQAGWDTIEAAAVLLTGLYPDAWITGDPDLGHYYERADGTV